MKKKMKKGLALVFGLALLIGTLNMTPAHADEAEPCDVHTYSYDCDTTCNICGHVRAASHTYNLYGQNYYYHWQKCECGAKLDIIAHDFDNDADLTCGECGYERHLEHDYSTPGADSTYHWDECSCGEKKNKEEHIMVAKSDGTWHWSECAECGTKVNIGAHVWGAGTTEGNVTTYTCTICGTQRTVTTGEGGSGDNTGEGGQGIGDNTNPGGDGTGAGNEGGNSGTGEGTGEGNGSGENAGDDTGDNGEGTGNNTNPGGDDSGDNAGSGDSDDTKDDEKKGGSFGKWLFGGIAAAVALWGGAIAGYLIYQKRKGSDKDSVKESKESV